MRILKHFVLVVALGFAACHAPTFMEHTQCKDTVLSQKTSPDGKFIVTVYHRSCAGGSGLYTCAKIEEVPKYFWSSRGETGYLMTIQEFYPITANWMDATHLEIDTPGLHTLSSDKFAADRPIPVWHNIMVSYK